MPSFFRLVMYLHRGRRCARSRRTPQVLKSPIVLRGPSSSLRSSCPQRMHAPAQFDLCDSAVLKCLELLLRQWPRTAVNPVCLLDSDARVQVFTSSQARALGFLLEDRGKQASWAVNTWQQIPQNRMRTQHAAAPLVACDITRPSRGTIS